MSLKIKKVFHYIPAEKVKLSEHYASYGLSESDMRIYTRFYGIDMIPVAQESMYHMLLAVSKPLLENIDKERIKYVIAARTAPIIFTWGNSIVRELVRGLELEKTIPFTIGMNKCVSTIRAFEVSEILLRTCEPGSLVLIVTGESVFTEQNRVLPNITVTGDGAAAALVSLDDGVDHELISISKEIIGEYAEGVWMSKEKVSEFGGIFNLSMNKVISEALNMANLTYENIKWIYPHNVSTACWRGFSKYANIPLDKIYLKNVPMSAHCFNSDLLLNLSTSIQEGSIKKGDYYLMATVGVGAMFGAAVFRY